MPKNNKTISIVMAVIAVTAVIVAGLFVFISTKDKSPGIGIPDPTVATLSTSQASSEKYETISGVVTFIDLDPLAYDGSGEIRIESSDGTRYTVFLTSGESLCDLTAIAIPNLKVGDRAQARGIINKDKIMVICETGTFIKRF